MHTRRFRFSAHKAFQQKSSDMLKVERLESEIRFTTFRVFWSVYVLSYYCLRCLCCIIVLLNGCFDINPVLCPRTVVLSLVQLYWPSARVNTAVRGHNTGLISKHPFHDTFINQYTMCKIQPISKHPILTYTLICKIQPINVIWRGGCLRHIPHFNVCMRK